MFVSVKWVARLRLIPLSQVDLDVVGGALSRLMTSR